MKKFKIFTLYTLHFTLIFTLYTLHFTLPIFAQFEDLGAGARGTGMSNAFTALADDVYAVYYNPAGLSDIKWKEMGLDYKQLYWGLHDGSSLGNSFVAYVHSFDNWGSFGVGWLNFTLSRYYTENTFILAYGKQIRFSAEGLQLPDSLKVIFSHLGSGSLRTGLKLKILSKTYGKTLYTENATDLDLGQPTGARDPVFARGYSRWGFSLDLGLLYEIDPRHTLGLTLNDINQPNMGLNTEDNKIHLGTKLGYAYKGRNFSMTTDIVFKHTDFTFTAGAEKWFLGRTFAIRGGLGLGTREYTNISLGGSYRHNGLLQLDYSFGYPLRGISNFYGTHQISLTLRFGAPVTREVPLDLESEIELRRLKLELENAKKAAEESKLQTAKEKEIKEKSEQLIREAQEKQRQAEEKLQQVEKELAHLKEEIKKISSEKEKDELLKRYWSSGMEYYNKEEYEKAISEFRKILEFEPGHKEAQERIKMSKEKLQHKIKAQVEKHYTRALRAYYADILEVAIKELEAALKLDPKNEEVRTLLERIKKEIELKKK